MTTTYLEYNGDFVVAPSGGRVQASGWDEVRQRIIRRFFTTPRLRLPDGTLTPPDYFFDPAFGVGARVYVGQNPTPQMLADIRQAMLAACTSDIATSKSIPPEVTVRATAQHIFFVIARVTLDSGQQGTIVLQVTG